jgi:hypothetical protein
MLIMSRGIFHKRRRKIMALIPLKAWTGIAALTLAAAVGPFVSATLANAIMLGFNDTTEEQVQVTIGFVSHPELIDRRIGNEFIQTKTFESVDALASTGTGGIRFVEPGTDITSDVIQVTITAVDNPPNTRITTFAFGSDPNLISNTAGFTVIDESVFLQGFVEVGTAQNPFRRDGTTIVSLPSDIQVFVQSDVQVPGPVVGAGLPGLVAACGGLLAWWRRRRQLT